MSKNLFDFTSEDLSNYEEEKQEKIKQEQTKSLKDKINEYKSKSQNELLEELVSSVQKQKENGSYNQEKLFEMINTVSPYLTQEQVENMKGLLEKINDI